jgi:hypothetical protein
LVPSPHSGTKVTGTGLLQRFTNTGFGEYDGFCRGRRGGGGWGRGGGRKMKRLAKLVVIVWETGA